MEGSSYDAQDEASIFGLLCLQAIFMPMQGFFNLLIYVRPNYLRLRNDYPNETKVWALRRSLYGASVEPRQHSRPTTHTNNSADGQNGPDGTNSGDSLAFIVGKATRLSQGLIRSSKEEQQEQSPTGTTRIFQLFSWRRSSEHDTTSIVSMKNAKKKANEVSYDTAGGYSSNNNSNNDKKASFDDDKMIESDLSSDEMVGPFSTSSSNIKTTPKQQNVDGTQLNEE